MRHQGLIPEFSLPSSIQSFAGWFQIKLELPPPTAAGGDDASAAPESPFGGPCVCLFQALYSCQVSP